MDVAVAASVAYVLQCNVWEQAQGLRMLATGRYQCTNLTRREVPHEIRIGEHLARRVRERDRDRERQSLWDSNDDYRYPVNERRHRPRNPAHFTLCSRRFNRNKRDKGTQRGTDANIPDALCKPIELDLQRRNGLPCAIDVPQDRTLCRVWAHCRHNVLPDASSDLQCQNCVRQGMALVEPI